MATWGTILFVFSLVIFLGTVFYIFTQTPDESPTPFSSEPPMSSMIGKACPVGCTCFPRQDTSGKQMCSYLDNNVMFGCPAECCTPSC